MPEIKEQRLDAELIAKVAQSGPCLAAGDELWQVAGKRLRVCSVLQVDEERNRVRVRFSDSEEWISPGSSILMKKLDKRINRAVAKVRKASYDIGSVE